MFILNEWGLPHISRESGSTIHTTNACSNALSHVTFNKTKLYEYDAAKCVIRFEIQSILVIRSVLQI